MKPLKWAAKSTKDLAKKIVEKIPNFASKVKGFIKKIPSKLPTWLLDSKAINLVKNGCQRFAGYIDNIFGKYKKEVSKHFTRIQITNELRTHVLNKHYLKKVLQEVKHAPIKRIKNIAEERSFFNPKWSKEQVLNATKYAYNYVKNTGKKGHTILKYKGEKITVFVKPNGTVKTIYGEYRYTAKQLMKMAGRK